MKVRCEMKDKAKDNMRNEEKIERENERKKTRRRRIPDHHNPINSYTNGSLASNALCFDTHGVGTS